jgi:hypothetical protein
VSCASAATVVPLGDAAQRNTCADQAHLKETDWRFFPQPSGTRNFFSKQTEIRFWDRDFPGQISKKVLGKIQRTRGPDSSLPTKRRWRGTGHHSRDAERVFELPPHLGSCYDC